MINILLDQPDVVVIVSDMFNKAQVLKDLYSKVGYQSLESFKSSTNEEIKDKSDYNNHVLDNMIHSIEKNINENIATIVLLPNIPTFISYFSKGLVAIAQDRFQDNPIEENKDLYIKYLYIGNVELKKTPIEKRVNYIDNKLEVVLVQEGI